VATQMISPDPPVISRSDFADESSYDAGNMQLGVASLVDNTVEHMNPPKTKYFKDNLSSTERRVENPYDMANTVDTPDGSTKQDLLHYYSNSTIKIANHSTSGDENSTTDETVHAASIPLGENQGPVGYHGGSNSEGNNPRTIDDAMPTSTIRHLYAEAPISSAQPRMARNYNARDACGVLDHNPGAVRVPGTSTMMVQEEDDSPPPYADYTISDLRRNENDMPLVTAILVEESEIQTMNALQQLRADLNQVVEHLHKEQQEDVTRKQSEKKVFSPFRRLLKPRRRTATGLSKTESTNTKDKYMFCGEFTY